MLEICGSPLAFRSLFFALQVKRANPEKNCFLEYDRLYIDHKIYVSSV